MKKNYKFVAMLLMVLCVSTFVFAQSNTSAATMGTIKADADYYMDVNNYKNANIENMFLYTNLSDSNVNLGFAKQFENFYLGTLYDGNLLLPTTDTDKEDTSDEENTTTENSFESTNSVTKTTTLQGNHDFATLFGLDGFALGLNASIELDGSITKSESTDIESGKNDLGEGKEVEEKSSVDTRNDKSNYYLGATLGGMNFDVSRVTVKPYASFGYTVNADGKLSDTTKTTRDSKVSMMGQTTITNTVDTKEINGSQKNPDSLSFTLGSEAVWGDKAGLFSIADLSYYISTGVGMNGAVANSSELNNHVDKNQEKENYTTTSNTVTYKESAKSAYNVISGSYRLEYAASEKLTLGARLGSIVTIRTSADGYTWFESTNDDTSWKPEEKEAYNKAEAEANKERKENALKAPLSTTKSTYIYNNFAIGMKYQLKPSFAINLGFNTNLPTFNKYKTVYTEKHTNVDEGADAESTEDDTTTNVNNIQTNSNWYIYESASHSLKAGFVWDITENLSLDSVLNISVRPSLDSIWKSAMSLSVTYKM